MCCLMRLLSRSRWRQGRLGKCCRRWCTHSSCTCLKHVSDQSYSDPVVLPSLRCAQPEVPWPNHQRGRGRRARKVHMVFPPSPFSVGIGDGGSHRPPPQTKGHSVEQHTSNIAIVAPRGVHSSTLRSPSIAARASALVMAVTAMPCCQPSSAATASRAACMPSE